MPRPAQRAWNTVLRVVRRDEDLRPALEQVLARCASLAPEVAWRSLLELTLEADAHQVARRLLDALDAEPPPAAVDELWFRLAIARWRERVDSCDVELRDAGRAALWCPAGGAAASSVLGQLLRVAGEVAAREPTRSPAATLLAEELPLAFAALAAQRLCARAAELLLGGRESIAVRVGFDGGPLLALGRLEQDGWDRAGFGLI